MTRNNITKSRRRGACINEAGHAVSPAARIDREVLAEDNWRLRNMQVESERSATWREIRRLRSLLERASLQLSYYDKGQDYELSLVCTDIANELEID